MQSIKKIAVVAVLGVVAFVGLMGSKWYTTTVSEAIHPERGIYGMDGLEIWIDLNARMPTFAREWGCKTLRAREKAALGWNSMPPYGCQDGFGTMPVLAAYDTIVKANVDQASAGLSGEKAQALRVCFDAKMAGTVTAEDIAAVNDMDVGDAMKKVILAVNETARACKAEVSG